MILPEGAIHVWRVALDAPQTTVEEATGLLSEEEARRASRFVFPRDRRRYIVAHSALRSILASYLAVPPTTLHFRSGAQGKPYLAGHSQSRQHPLPLHFNLAHSGEMALVACVWGQEVGVDVEEVRPMPDLAAIAARFFAPGERQALLALPPEEQTLAFFTCWTRKEAYMKAVGAGLGYPLDQFEVTLGPGVPARFLSIGGDAEEAARWGLAALAPAAGYVGALAVRQTDYDYVML